LLVLRSDFRGSAASPAFIALSCVGFIASATPAFAQDAAPAEGKRLGGVTVTGTAIEDETKVERVASPKATAPLLDTPQTITVISNQTIRQQNLLTLRDALATIPGITFGAGEGGGGFGDSINLRGFSANNDITQDGVRDSAQYSRTDPFNLQQIEVYNGANSVFNGSGSVGGTINLVSKKPQAEDLTVIEAGVGTDDYYRATVDSNLRVNEMIAVRLNGMFHRNDYPGRDVEKFERWGVAPAITLGIGSPTRLTFDYFHQEDDNTPAYGVPFFITPTSDGPLPGVDDSDYFGIRNLDDQRITTDRLTMTFEHEFSDAISIRNLTRWQRVGQRSVTSAPQGAFCLANGQTPLGIACPVGQTPGIYYPTALTNSSAGARGLVRDQENQLLFNQTDLRFVSGEEGGVRNTLVIGAALAQEDYQIETASLLRNPDGTAATQPPISISDPDTVYTGPINYTVFARAKSETTNKAIYAFDTLELGAFELNAGVRYESNKAEFRNLAIPNLPVGATLPDTTLRANKENLFSWRVGGVFKPSGNSSLYIAYANSRTPSSATVRLGCTSGSGATFSNFCDVAPEKARNFEIGAKADVLDRKLQLTAALFRNERTNFRVPTLDPGGTTTIQVPDGRSRVDGLALGAAGKITDAWSLFANYTYLDSEVLQSIADDATGTDPQRGDALVQTPKHSASLWTTYLFPFGLQVGYGFTYQGSISVNQSVASNLVQFRTDDYLTHRAMLSYAFANGLTAQLNIQNLTDKRYFTSVRSNVNATTGIVTGGWAVPGEARSARLSLFYSF
jgi:catecholate siderophore receptor